MTTIQRKRSIRSFVRREGRMTAGQQQSLIKGWPLYGLSIEAGQLDLITCFGRAAKTTLEIGFGDGQSLLTAAKLHPEQNFIGIEVFRIGVAKLMMALEKAQLTNVRVFCADALPILSQVLAPSSIDEVHLFFPDPWPKTKHHKRRLVQTDFVRLVSRVLRLEGLFYLATDWQPYAEHMLTVLEERPEFANLYGKNTFAPRLSFRPLTKFEQRGLHLGHGTWDLAYQRVL